MYTSGNRVTKSTRHTARLHKLLRPEMSPPEPATQGGGLQALVLGNQFKRLPPIHDVPHSAGTHHDLPEQPPLLRPGHQHREDQHGQDDGREAHLQASR